MKELLLFVVLIILFYVIWDLVGMSPLGAIPSFLVGSGMYFIAKIIIKLKQLKINNHETKSIKPSN